MLLLAALRRISGCQTTILDRGFRCLRDTMHCVAAIITLCTVVVSAWILEAGVAYVSLESRRVPYHLAEPAAGRLRLELRSETILDSIRGLSTTSTSVITAV